MWVLRSVSDRIVPMHSFHKYIAGRVSELLAKRHVVVFYDPREEFRSFIGELAMDEGDELSTVHINGGHAHYAEFEGSYFELRFKVEPIVAEHEPAPLLIYIPGRERDREESVLMELEKAGATYEPQLKRLARHVLRKSYTEGQIDKFLAPEAIAYSDIANLLRQAEKSDAPSLLKALYEDHTGTDLIVRWLATPTDDERIASKEASEELYELIEERIGLSVPAETDLQAARAKTFRYLLLGEFRSDLEADEPPSLSQMPAPTTVDHRRRVLEATSTLRATYPDRYQEIARQIEQEFQLPSAGLKAEDLGQLDTFSFEAEIRLAYAGDLIVEADYQAAQRIIQAHRKNYWVQRDIVRQAQWEAVRLMAQLGREVERVRHAMAASKRSAQVWFDAYTEEDGWYKVDAAQRVLEDWVANMDDEPIAEQALGKVRNAYEVLLGQMAEEFTETLMEGGWALDGPLAQTHVYQQFVERGAGPTAYILADALRYEMGVELSQQLEAAQEMKVRPAVAQLPTITSVGMAALLPDASKSFAVVEDGGEIAAKVEGRPLKKLDDRRKMLREAVPNLVDMKLEDVLQHSKKKLRRTVDDAPLILVRSQEIDALGEQGLSHMARQVMTTVIGNIGRAVRKLADVGIKTFVIAADHGHQFAREKGDHMKIEAPGGDTVKLTRRCWAGRGGTTPQGTVRVQGADLGYETDLEFVFPKGAGVFKSGGDLSFHHGGSSLQELAVPVLSFHMKEEGARDKQVGPEVKLLNEPREITNRTFPVSLHVQGDLFVDGPVPLRVVVVSNGEQVGEARMAMEAEIDEERGLVLVKQGTDAMVGLILTRDTVKQVRIIVQDPQSGSVFTQSDLIPVKLSI